jgi:hypothetical protein
MDGMRTTATVHGPQMPSGNNNGVLAIRRRWDKYIFIFAVHDDGQTKMVGVKVKDKKEKKFDERLCQGIEPIDDTNITKAWDTTHDETKDLQQVPPEKRPHRRPHQTRVKSMLGHVGCFFIVMLFYFTSDQC